MTEAPMCLCGCAKFEHLQGKGRCRRCGTCDAFELDGRIPVTVDPFEKGKPDVADDAMADLLNRAVATETPRLVRLADKIQDLVDQLTEQLADHEREASLRAEAAQLEQRLAEIKAQLGAGSAPAIGSRAVRRWALDNGVECPTHGRVPAAVLAAYRQATST